MRGIGLTVRTRDCQTNTSPMRGVGLIFVNKGVRIDDSLDNVHLARGWHNHINTLTVGITSLILTEGRRQISLNKHSSFRIDRKSSHYFEK